MNDADSFSNNCCKILPRINNDDIKIYSDKIIFINNGIIEFHPKISIDLKAVLSSGLINPYSVNKIGKIKISELREIISTNTYIRKYQFWIYPTNSNKSSNKIENALNSRTNPDEYYFELENTNAKSDSDIQSFLKGAKMIVFKYNGIII
ncbi:hypothetical protein [Rhizosphaericola mali]|uniref:Uncharacterized protein n=1 Tax=Rhizosphaericola mali TaxID=2545455 RepID=A0A5P2GFT6_9BACT|nr:hypothetical protein [Rhizosphaericola mali]QES90501.1 hypothetical protein E0W69_018175 [Rhizosphaericola mali]